MGEGVCCCCSCCLCLLQYERLSLAWHAFHLSLSLSPSLLSHSLSLALPPSLFYCLSAAAPAVWIHNSACCRACGLGSLSKQPGRKKNEETERELRDLGGGKTGEREMQGDNCILEPGR